MPRTPDLNLVVDEFQRALDVVIVTWRTQRLHRVVLGRDTIHAASTAALTRVATQWEYFRSEWHKKAIARDATQYRDELSRRLRGLAEATQPGKDLVVALRDLGLQVEINLPKYPTIDAVSRLRDSKGQNALFRTQKDSDDAARRDLIPSYAAKPLALDHDDWIVIGLMIAIRNALAHSSTMSINAMNSAIRGASRTRQPELRQLARDTNRVTASGIGMYLTSSMAWGNGTATRVMVIATYLRGLGDKFRI